MQHWYTSLPLDDIQKQYGHGAWIVSEQQLCANLNRLAAFTGAPERIFYPVKCNPSIPVLQILAAAGAGADCANMNEINHALICGFSPERIIYNGPIQDWRTIHFVLESGGTVVLDDPAVMEELDKDRYWENLPGQMWLRINPCAHVDYEYKDNLQELMAHGSESSKFGVPEEEVIGLLERIKLPITGLHLHVGTQMDNLYSFQTALQSLHRVADSLISAGLNIAHLDIGGGLGIAFSVAQKFPSIEEWVDALITLKSSNFSYYAEPGHALVGDAVCLLITVETIKQSRGKRWAVCNIGTDQLAKITLLKWEHPVYCGDGLYLSHEGPDALAGPLCFAGDVLVHHTDVSALRVGQPLLLTKAGAYLFALSNAFNGRAAVPWLVTMRDGSMALSVHKEDMFNRVYLQQTEWQLPAAHEPEMIDPDRVVQLQSQYMTSLLTREAYVFEQFEKIGPKRYRVRAKVISEVDFISMPLALRVIGDAIIVAILHDAGSAHKDHAVWGKKITMDYFTNVNSKDPFCFVLTLSHDYNHNRARRMMVSFETINKGIQGMLVAHH